MSTAERPQTRRLPAVLAALCFFVTALFGLFAGDGLWLFVGVCTFVGFVMTSIVNRHAVRTASPRS